MTKWSHLYGVGAMLQQRWHTSSTLYRGLKVPTSSIESYLVHLALNSTISLDVVVTGTTPDFVDECLHSIANERNITVSKLELLGVPAVFISLLFELAHLRDAICQQKVSKASVFKAIEASQVLNIPARQGPAKFAVVDILYTHACRVLLDVLVHAAQARHRLEGYMCPDTRVDWQAVEFSQAIDFVCAAHAPSHIIAWPLFVIGVACKLSGVRQKIVKSFRRMIDDTRLGSAQGALETMELSWATLVGEKILLSSHLKAVLMF